MLSRSIASSPSVSSLRASRPVSRCVSRSTVRVQAKKSRDQELEEAYEEQLAYLERRRQRLISPRAPKKPQGGQVAATSSPVVQAQAPQVKKPAVKEPTIQVAVEEETPKKGAGNPLGFLSSLFGAK